MDIRSPNQHLAGSLIQQAKQRLLAMGLASRTTLIGVLMLLLGFDLLMLPRGGFQGPVTSIQSAALLVAVVSALRGLRTAQLRSVRRTPTRRIAYLALVSAVVITALVQKWSIVLMANASRPAYGGTYRVMAAAVTFGGVALVLIHSQRLARFFVAFAEQPARQTALSFLAVTLFGAFLLTMPVCVRDPSHVAFVDALFMATSAVCVTGLAVHGVATEYTLVGQAVLLALVQVGGLGIMVLSASVVVLTGRKLRARSSAVLAEVLDADSIASLRGTIRGIVGFTLAIEFVGAVLLYLAFAQHPDVALGVDSPQPASGSGGLIWAAIFHSVSAFCNAGFSLMHGGLEPFVSSYAVCTIVMVLIVLGGLGFPVLAELLRWCVQKVQKKRPLRLSLHTRTVLLMSAGLIVAVGLVLVAVEWKGALAGLPWHVRMFAALFQSVTLRTAGFNTVSFGSFTNAGLMIAMLFMFIGASPGGTGGGVKVTTFAVLFATLRAELGHGREPHLLDRRLPSGTIRRAISVVFMSVIVLTFSVLSLLLSEQQEALRLAFEAVSAFGTVGLSTGITPDLTTVGKLVIIVTMLIGRVGPLTVALATAERSDRAHHMRPHERVLIG